MVNTDAASKFLKEGLTFDDVLLIPAKSDILPKEVSVATRLTRTITLNTPLMTAAMDTVTEARMAIAIAREGGIGVIHKNMSIEEQADQVDRVKRSENGVIVNPFFLSPDHLVADANELMGKYKISGVPVCRDGKLVGILTNRDMRFLTDFSQRIEEVMTKENLVTAPVGTTLEQAQEILRQHRIEKLPIVDGQGMLKGLITIKDIEKAVKYPNSARDKDGRLLCAAAIGATADVLERAGELVKAQVDALVLDSAHGHSQNILGAVSKVKAAFPDVSLIAGNIATADARGRSDRGGCRRHQGGDRPRLHLYHTGGGGHRVPQITAIYDAACMASKYGVPVIADGGIKYSGDIVKAVAAGANAIMIGSLVAGCEESPGTPRSIRDASSRCNRGMGSLGAMSHGSKDRYFQEDNKKLVPEGVEGRCPTRAPCPIRFTSSWAACGPVWVTAAVPHWRPCRKRGSSSGSPAPGSRRAIPMIFRSPKRRPTTQSACKGIYT